MYQVNQRVRIVSGPWASDCGTIRKIQKKCLLVEVDSGARGLAAVKPHDVEPIRIEEISSVMDESHLDFSHSGLGVGGLANYDEPVTIPSVAAIKQMERIEREMTVCRRCGESDILDGAMFTTGGGDVCDDCF